MNDSELVSLAEALREAGELLQKHGDRYTSERIKQAENRLRAGDTSAIVTAFSEATGGMGSLNDRYLCPQNDDAIGLQDVVPVNDRLSRLVREVERRARVAAAAHRIALLH
ncbi:MAG: hypothetical protein QOH86_1364 [Sphingomonadales bacterium]|jgi:hypothetical protein|nr:hypothetical protein [Sphingomonadales bacterium]